MTMLLAQFRAPAIDYAGLAPLMAVSVGSMVVLMVGLFRGALVQRVLVPALSAVSLILALVLTAAI